jgi:tetratricopeptide (TPR) repeat protein
MLLQSMFMLSLTLGNLGRMSEALQTLNEAIDMARRNGDHFFLPRLPNCIGWIHRELQDFGQAFEHDQRGVDLAREDHVLEAEANSLINLGYDYRHEGEHERSLAAFRESETIFQRDAWFRWRYNIRLQAGTSEYWLARGDIEQAELYARRLLETATHHEVRKYIAVAHKLLAETSMARNDLAAAEQELSAALDVLRDHPAVLVAWRTYAALGHLRLKLGDHQMAREAFAQAADIVGQIAANVTDPKLRATFLNSATVREVLEGSKNLHF